MRSNTTFWAARLATAVRPASVHAFDCADRPATRATHQPPSNRAGGGSEKPRRSSISANVKTTRFAYRPRKYLYSDWYSQAFASCPPSAAAKEPVVTRTARCFNQRTLDSALGDHVAPREEFDRVCGRTVSGREDAVDKQTSRAPGSNVPFA